MKMKTVLLLVVAVVCGTAASRMSKRLFSSSPEPREEPVAEKLVVLAAKEPLTAGTVLREPDRLFEERTLTRGEEPAQALSRLHQLRGRRLAKAIAARAVVTADHLVDEEGESLELLKKEGRQAFAVAVQSLGGTLFLPQARVDVIWTPTATGATTDSRLVAQDLPLLGVRTKDGGTTVATVAAKREDAEKLTQAAGQGTLRLVTRQGRDGK